MDSSSVHATSPIEQDDEWDTEGFVIPSLGIENPNQDTFDAPKVADSKDPPSKDKLEQIYLGPHGAPPSPKQQDANSSNRKKQFKQKLKEADRKSSFSGRENKVESLKELVGGSSKSGGNMTKSSPKEWLDPHCNEAMFEKRHLH